MRGRAARHTGFKAVSTGWGNNTTDRIPSPLMETFAKLSGTAIICLDSQSLKLRFAIDSRLRGNDGRFCKGLLDGKGIKGEGENDAPASSRHCGLDPQSRGEADGLATRQHQPPRPVILALRQYPHGGAIRPRHSKLHPFPKPSVRASHLTKLTQ